jgi:hypothetical protein
MIHFLGIMKIFFVSDILILHYKNDINFSKLERFYVWLTKNFWVISQGKYLSEI